jgi:hypothetical protein
MKKVPIRKGQIWQDKRTGRRVAIFGLNGQHGWNNVWEGQGHSSSRHLKENVPWKFYRLVEDEP